MLTGQNNPVFTDQFRAAYQQASDGPGRLAVIRRHFETDQLTSASHIDAVAGALLYVVDDFHDRLVVVSNDPSEANEVSVRCALTGEAADLLRREDLNRAIAQGQTAVLRLKAGASNATGPTEAAPAPASGLLPAAQRERIIQTGSLLSQLAVAASRLAFFGQANEIEVVRTNLFGEGLYEKAWLKLDDLNRVFNVAAEARLQELRAKLAELERTKYTKGIREVVAKKTELNLVRPQIVSVQRLFNLANMELRALVANEPPAKRP